MHYYRWPWWWLRLDFSWCCVSQRIQLRLPTKTSAITVWKREKSNAHVSSQRLWRDCFLNSSLCSFWSCSRVLTTRTIFGREFHFLSFHLFPSSFSVFFLLLAKGKESGENPPPPPPTFIPVLFLFFPSSSMIYLNHSSPFFSPHSLLKHVLRRTDCFLLFSLCLPNTFPCFKLCSNSLSTKKRASSCELFSFSSQCRL